MDSNYFFGLPLKHSFVEYVYLNGLFLPHEIKGVRSLWKDQETVKATLSGDEKYNDELRKSSVMSIGSESEYKWFMIDLQVLQFKPIMKGTGLIYSVFMKTYSWHAIQQVIFLIGI